MRILVPGGKVAIGGVIGTGVDGIQRCLCRELEHAGENRHGQRCGYRSVHESFLLQTGPWTWGVWEDIGNSRAKCVRVGCSARNTRGLVQRGAPGGARWVGCCSPGLGAMGLLGLEDLG
ncbi:hypothetical protein D3C81_1668940 [compost metagenome]